MKEEIATCDVITRTERWPHVRRCQVIADGQALTDDGWIDVCKDHRAEAEAEGINTRGLQ